MKTFADADLHAGLGRCLQSENSSRLPGHRWVGHSCHLHVHPSLHSSTGTIESRHSALRCAWSEILCTLPRASNLLPRRTTSGRSLRWRRVWRTRRRWSLGGWSRRRCAGEWSSFWAEDLHSPRWVWVRTEFSVGTFCINLLVKAIFRVVKGTCDFSDTWWDWWEGRTWPTRRQIQRVFVFVFFKDICNFLWRFSAKVIDEIISKKSGLKHRKRRHTRVLNKVCPRPPSTLVSQLSWWSS